jgi:hypothetical protein
VLPKETIVLENFRLSFVANLPSNWARLACRQVAQAIGVYRLTRSFFLVDRVTCRVLGIMLLGP